MFTKKYFCSNDPGTVAKILAGVDMAFSIGMIFFLSCFVNMYLYYPESLQHMTEERPEKQEDLLKFLAWGTQKKAVMLAIPFTGSFLNGVKAILLFIGASKRHLVITKTWLILTIIFFISGMIFFIPELIFTQDKALIIIMTILDGIYDCYSVWVVKGLYNQLYWERKTTRNIHIRDSGPNTISEPASYDRSDPDVETELTNTNVTSIEKL